MFLTVSVEECHFLSIYVGDGFILSGRDHLALTDGKEVEVDPS